MHHKGIILTAGSGTRLWPMTLSVNKQMLPVYDKPMIFYPLTLLMEAHIRDILIVTDPSSLEAYQMLLQDGSPWGISISYCVQKQPRGISDAFLIGEHFIGQDPVTLLLGDNIFYSKSIQSSMKKTLKKASGATLFAYQVDEPSRYGVVAFNEKGKPISLEEKPEYPQSHYAVTGLYCYDNHVIDIAKTLTPSARGELEITDLNRCYLKEKKLSVEILSEDTIWLDAGTPMSLLDAGNFIRDLEIREGLKVGCPEEVAWRLNFIQDEALARAAQRYSKNDYGQYLLNLLSQKQNLSAQKITPYEYRIEA